MIHHTSSYIIMHHHMHIIICTSSYAHIWSYHHKHLHMWCLSYTWRKRTGMSVSSYIRNMRSSTYVIHHTLFVVIVAQNDILCHQYWPWTIIPSVNTWHNIISHRTRWTITGRRSWWAGRRTRTRSCSWKGCGTRGAGSREGGGSLRHPDIATPVDVRWLSSEPWIGGTSSYPRSL